MFSESAELYDLLYSSFKDYRDEAGKIVSLLEDAYPNARTILDVGCGTGEHARILSYEHGFVVDGIDIEPAFVRIAQRKNPHGAFWQADMTTFALPKRYDVILCLFSAIGYVKTLENVTKTLTNFTAHLADDGVVVVEPWFGPGQLEDGKVFMKTAEADHVQVCRMSHTEIEGRLSRLRFEYLIERRDGITRSSELHELGLFTVEEMKTCFEEVGLRVDFDEEGLYGRGLYLARRAA